MSEEFLSADIRKKLREFELQVRFTCSACRGRASDASAGSGTGCLGILGPSGCGKSMTLKSIAGIVEPDSGSIILDGRELFNSSRKVNLKPQKRRVGYLFQNYALFPNMTVEENILTGLKAGKRYGEAQQNAVQQLLAEGIRPDGILCGEDLTAAGVLKALLRAGIRVPEETAVVGYDNSTYARLCEPELTSVDNKPEQVALLCVQLLRSRIEHGEDYSSVTLQPELVQRQSS